MLAPRTIHSDLKQLGHDEDFAPRPPAEPTQYEPGSRGKIAVMRARVERGESLWHPQDNQAQPRLGDAQLPIYQPGIRQVEFPVVAQILGNRE